jgi:hypothetical protein
MSEFNAASPSITTMIRMDHTHALCASHRYRLSSLWWRKRAIVGSVCTALEIHATLEEEVFYPALARVAPTTIRSKKASLSITKCARSSRNCARWALRTQPMTGSLWN